MLGDFGLDFREVIGRGLELRAVSGVAVPKSGGGGGGNAPSTGEGRADSRSKSRARGTT